MCPAGDSGSDVCGQLQGIVQFYPGRTYEGRGGADGVRRVFAADQPFLTKETIEEFVETMLEKKALLGCVAWGGRRGNPVWFSGKYFQELCLLKKDEGGRRVLERHEEEIYWFEVGDGRELADIDTAEDAERGIQDAGILQTD